MFRSLVVDAHSEDASVRKICLETLTFNVKRLLAIPQWEQGKVDKNSASANERRGSLICNGATKIKRAVKLSF
jgi:hypothetical protein